MTQTLSPSKETADSSEVNKSKYGLITPHLIDENVLLLGGTLDYYKAN